MKKPWRAFIFLFLFVSSTISGEVISIMTIPKSGTHLAQKLVQGILQQSGCSTKTVHPHFYFLGKPYRPLPKSAVLLRDLRDVIVSFAYFLNGRGNHINWTNSFKDIVPYSLLPTFQEKLAHLLTPGNELHEFIIRNCEECRVACQNPTTFQLRFEDLVGEKGGGSDEAQRMAIAQFAQFLGCALEEESLDLIQSNLFGGTGTFRKGQIGSWKEEFTPEHVQLFERSFGAYNHQFGYIAH